MKVLAKKKSYTLIELLITIAIVTLLSILSVAIFELQRDKVKNLDNATFILKDAILSTQNLAFAPQEVDAKYYVLAINLSSDTAEDFGPSGSSYSIKPKTYAVFWTDDRANPTKNLPPRKEEELTQDVTFTSDYPKKGSSNILAIWFKVYDGSLGFQQGIFPEDGTDWDDLWVSSGTDYADIKITENRSGFDKTIKVNKLTGEVNV